MDRYTSKLIELFSKVAGAMMCELRFPTGLLSNKIDYTEVCVLMCYGLCAADSEGMLSVWFCFLKGLLSEGLGLCACAFEGCVFCGGLISEQVTF